MQRLCNVPNAAPFFVPTTKQDRDHLNAIQHPIVATVTRSLYTLSREIQSPCVPKPKCGAAAQPRPTNGKSGLHV